MNTGKYLTRIFLAITAITLPISAMAQKSELQRAQEDAAAISKIEISSEVKRDVLPSLKDVLIAPSKERRIRETRGIPRPVPYTGIPQPEVVDTVRQISVNTQSAGKAGGPLAPVATIGQNFDGLGKGIPGFIVVSAPPDAHGAVGSTQYVQIVNGSAFAVYNKATGALVMGPAATNSLWAGFGGKCENSNDGDPIVNFDAIAQRWVITQFAITPRAAPFFECVAVSQTADATGGYFRYAFQYNEFPDYPKFAVHPDAYYFTFNMFNPAGSAFIGARACAYDRARMLQGLAATQQCFSLPAGSDYSLLPSDPDGSSPVAAGSPNYMVSLRRDNNTALSLYKFRANFVNPALTSFTGPTLIPVAPYTQLCSGDGICVPQPSTTTQLDALGDRMMSRLSYRRYPDGRESLVTNHSISTGLRWYEIRNPGAATPVLFQQGTYAPSADTRWMGAMAQDKNGNFLVGYSASSNFLQPSLRVAARAATDAVGTLGVENTIITGTGVQTTFFDGVKDAPLSRWGDYSSMTVDPVDNCTFWFTGEYLKADGSFNWNTRIASVKLAGCDAEIVVLNPSFPLSNGGSRVVTIAELANLNGQAASIASFSPATGNGTAVIAPGGASVTYTARRITPNRCEPADVLLVPVPYSIRNTANGALVTGNVTFEVAYPAGPPATRTRPCP
jgi:hypothetical protein